MSDIPSGVSIAEPTPEEIAIKKLIESNQDLQDAMKATGMSFNDVIKKFDESKDIEKEQSKETTEYFERTKDSLKENYENLKQSTFEAVTSPLSTLMSPLKEHFGVNLGGIFSSLKEDVDKKGKKNPKESDVVKTGDEGTNTLFLANKLEELLQPEDEGMMGGKLGGLAQMLGLGAGGAGISALVTKALPMLGKALGIGAIIAGLVWAIIDGVKGFFLSDEWGASKVSSALAGFFAGTGTGWKNAFANAGKWALVGAGIGFLAGGPVGALAGGIGGAVFGGVIGFFGGKKVAGFFDKIPGFLKKLWDSEVVQTIIEWFALPFMVLKDVIVGLFDDFKAIWMNEEDSIAKKIGKTIGKIFFIIPDLLGKFFGSLFKRLKSFGKNRKEVFKAIGSVILKLIKGIGTLIIESFKFMKNVPSLIRNKLLPAVGAFFKDSFLPVVKDLFSGIKESIVNHPIMEGIRNAVFGTIEWLSDFFEKLKKGFSNFMEDPIGFAKNILDKFIFNITEFFATIGDFFSFIGDMGVIDLIKNIADGGFGSIGDSFKEYSGVRSLERREAAGITKVNDAIITKTGQVIETAPDDNIIATKANPQKIMDSSFGENKLMLQLINAINLLAKKLDLYKPQIITNVVRPLMSEEDLGKFEF